MILFSDGGCINNGKKNAIASYAVYINTYVIRGHVLSYEYNYIDNKLICNYTKPIIPSNNRGELMAIIRAFMEILINDDNSDHVLYSDSNICVKTINEWYPTRLKNGTTDKFKNFDLIKIMMELFSKINITVIHIRGHQKINNGTTELQKKIINGNNIADKYASEILHTENMIIYERIDLNA